MQVSVDLDRDVRLLAEEVDDAISERMLTSDLVTELAISHRLPEQLFFMRCAPPELAAAAGHVRRASFHIGYPLEAAQFCGEGSCEALLPPLRGRLCGSGEGARG